MSAPIIAIIGPGAMGAGVTAGLIKNGCTVLTPLSGRSAATQKRATDAGMEDTTLDQIVGKADWILSILPPGEAMTTAQNIRDAIDKVGTTRHLVYVDCNAVRPETAKHIAAVFDGTGVGFVDVGIIGMPPNFDGDGKVPAFYASSDATRTLDAFEKMGKQRGLRVMPLRGEGVGVGDASALKMSYSGISKGTIGLWVAMILAAHASSPATAAALVSELGASQSQVLKELVYHVPIMIPKAYRWIAEMEELGAFVGPLGMEGDIYRGLGMLFERVAQAAVTEREVNVGGDIQVLEEFVRKSRKVLHREDGNAP